MSRPNSRHLLAVLVCLVVVSAVLGAPVAGVAAADRDGLDGVFDSDETDTSARSDDASSSENRQTTADSSPERTPGRLSDSDSTLDGTASGDGSEDWRSSGDFRDRLRAWGHKPIEAERSPLEVGSVGADDRLQGAVETTTETLEPTAPTLALVVFPGERRLAGPGVGALGLVDADDDSLADPDGLSADDVAGRTPLGVSRAASESASDSETPAASADDDPTAGGSPLSGDGGQPLPPESAGGAAVGLGVLAGAAAIRTTPVVGGIGASGLGSTASGVLSSLLDRIRPFLLPLRYSRYDDSDPLEHEARERVYRIVNETPGSYLSEVSERAGLPLSTTRHHVRVLEREDLVSGAKLRGKRRFYPAYAEGVELAAALNDDATASIIDALARLGAASVSDLADDLGRDPSTISHHLQRLDEDDIVTREREGRAVLNRLSAEARTALEPDSTPEPGEAGEALAGGAD